MKIMKGTGNVKMIAFIKIVKLFGNMFERSSTLGLPRIIIGLEAGRHIEIEIKANKSAPPHKPNKKSITEIIILKKTSETHWTR
ncbi:MAG: hypothetical protein ACTSPV_19300 [Candidatus Hodarchaeales archaeon]